MRYYYWSLDSIVPANIILSFTNVRGEISVLSSSNAVYSYHASYLNISLCVCVCACVRACVIS